MFLLLSAVSMAAVRLAAQSACTVAPEVSDTYTALLDSFDGSTLGQVYGSVSYGPSVKGLDLALQFSKNAWIEYNLSGWYQWTSNYSPSGIYGAIELWLKPATPRVAADFLIINWNNTATAPPAGYITELGLDSKGRLTFGGWTSITDNPYDTPFSQPHTIIPQDTFTHIAYTWSPNGTAVYVNGSLEATSSLSYYPALNPTVYVYLNPWGSNVLAAVDELRISSIARADLMSCAR
jgi:hypothetical protein